MKRPTKPGPDWRKHPRQFFCRCEACLASCGPMQRKVGKFWQRGYGEPPAAFRLRYRAAHKART